MVEIDAFQSDDRYSDTDGTWAEVISDEWQLGRDRDSSTDGGGEWLMPEYDASSTGPFRAATSDSDTEVNEFSVANYQGTVLIRAGNHVQLSTAGGKFVQLTGEW